MLAASPSAGQIALLLAWIAFLLILGVSFLRHPPLRRVVAALYVLCGFAVRYLWRRLRGERQQAGPAELRRAFERLGPTYIKLGQLIASSSGLFSTRYVEEFKLCLDRVPPEPWPVVRETLRRSLGQPPERLLRSIESQPLASASIAQVYGVVGSDDDGHERELVIKVQRRGLPALVNADIDILAFSADLLARVPRLRNANPRGIVAEFDRTIHEELDFVAEAACMDEFNRIMKELGRTDVCAPRPVHRLCTPEVLTMERFHGVRVDDVEELRRRGYDSDKAEAKLIAGMHAWFQSLIHYGFFHGDVHAGNLMLLDDGRIGFLDFGIIGRMDREQRHQIASYIMAFAIQDFRALAGAMARMGAVDGKQSEADWAEFAADLKEAYSPFLRGSLQQIDYSEVIPNMLRISARHGIRLPSEFVLVTRQLLYFDRYAKLLAPSLNLFADPRLVMTIGAEFARL